MSIDYILGKIDNLEKEIKKTYDIERKELLLISLNTLLDLTIDYQLEVAIKRELSTL